MTRYLFYDDEIANSKQYICSLGYVCTDEDDNELARDYTLIDPESDYGFYETGVHGLTAEDTAGKMSFKDYCETTNFLSLLSECVLVTHGGRNADLSHLRKSFEHYGMELPPIRYIDTKEMADHIEGLKSSGLKAVCGHYGIRVKEHHNAFEDALACRKIFWHLLDDLGSDYGTGDYIPGETMRRAPKRKRPTGTLGLVSGSNQTVEELLGEFESLGLLADVEDIVAIGPCPMKFSGVANGMSSDEVETTLKDLGYGSGKNKSVTGNPGKKTVFFAVGDNVGPSKIKAAKENNVRVIALADFLDAIAEH